jgi:hypothetical protein
VEIMTDGGEFIGEFGNRSKHGHRRDLSWR